MFIPRIVYDSSCNYYNDNQYSSIESTSLFDLSKNFLLVLADNVDPKTDKYTDAEADRFSIN